MVGESRGQKRLQLWGLLGPGLAWLALFFNLPLLMVFFISLVERGRAGGIKLPPVFTLQSYIQVFDPLYVGILGESLRIALIVTIACLLVSYPLAFFIAKRNVRIRGALILLVMIPFWTNFLVRTYALKQLLDSNGLVNSFLLGLGFVSQPLDLLFNEFAVVLGLIYGYLPFAALPIYASIEKFDFSLLEAAADLGAPAWRSFLKIMLPITAPGVVAAFVLVFVPVIGAFITPEIMGGGKVEMIGTLINRQFGSSRNWPFGSAISLILMVIVLVGVVFYFRSSPEEQRKL